MAKRSFKFGGNDRSVVTVTEAVTESATDAGTVPAIDSPEAGVVVDAVMTPEGWAVIEGGFEVVTEAADDTEVSASEVEALAAVTDSPDAGSPVGCEPDVVNVLQALRADDDGMGEMRAVEAPIGEEAAYEVPGFVVVTDAMLATMLPPVPSLPELVATPMFDGPVSADVTDAALDVVASQPSVFAQMVAQHRPIVADCVVRVDLPAMMAVDARAMAQRIADMTGVAVNVFGPDGAESIAPKRGGGGGVRAVRAPTVTSASGAADKAPKLTPGLTVAGDWLTYDARVVCTHPGNASNIKTWEKIRERAAMLDLDSLLAFDFAGARDESSGNTYTKNNGRFLRAHIANVEKRIAEREAARIAAEAALDAEFGPYRLAAD